VPRRMCSAVLGRVVREHATESKQSKARDGIRDADRASAD
jgi:hypothetical protein